MPAEIRPEIYSALYEFNNIPNIVKALFGHILTMQLFNNLPTQEQDVALKASPLLNRFNVLLQQRASIDHKISANPNPSPALQAALKPKL